MGKDHSKKAKIDAAGLTSEERELFLNAFYQGEIPNEKVPVPAGDGATKLAKITPYEAEEDDRELFLNALSQGIGSPKSKEYDSQKRGERAQERLRKKGRVDCTIDLHGMYAKDAAAALLRFIREEKARGAKTMLVIHGKGAGVLKNAVWSIIKTHPDIDDFQQASWRHGGSGAIIIRVNSRRRP